MDNFVRDHLPPKELWPEMRYDRIPELAYPAHVNIATELLDRNVENGNGERIALRWPGKDGQAGAMSYAELQRASNQIANVLVEDYGLQPGQRVLLRAPNNPQLAACWFAVLKAGGIVVCTMPLLRQRELKYILAHAHIDIAICDHRFAAELHEVAGDVPILRFGNGDLEAAASAKPMVFENVKSAREDVAIIAYTSGTTGDAKATVHFHQDMVAICDCFPPYVLKANADDLFCGSPPLAFTFGLGGLLMHTMRV